MTRLALILILSVWLLAVECLIEECYPHFCLAGKAKCQNNTACACNNPPYSWGSGNFACYQHNQIAAEVKQDPVLTTFNNDSVKLDVPCRYLLTSVKLRLKKKGGQRIGFCQFEVHASHKRVKGKIIIDGIEIATKIQIENDYVKEMSLITSGQYGHVDLGGTDNAYLPNGPYGKTLNNHQVIFSDHGNNIYIKRYYNPDNRQYLFTADGCGFRASFVPYDLNDGIKSPYVPGISLIINCEFHPTWMDVKKVMALPPAKGENPDVSTFAHNLGLTTKQAMAYRAFTSNIPQTQPNSCKECSEVGKVLHKCDAKVLRNAFDNCYWILETPSFISCLSGDRADTPSGSHLAFFSVCIDHYCDGQGRCIDLKKTTCHYHLLTNILTKTCSSDM